MEGGLFVQGWIFDVTFITFPSQPHDSEHGDHALQTTGLSGAKAAGTCEDDLMAIITNKWLVLPLPGENNQSSRCLVEGLARRRREEKSIFCIGISCVAGVCRSPEAELP